MSDQPASPSSHKAEQARRRTEREARRKAELKANMARRKAQTRARSDGAGAETQGTALAIPDADGQLPQDDAARAVGGQSTNSETAKR
jgi:hypothetical protein